MAHINASRPVWGGSHFAGSQTGVSPQYQRMQNPMSPQTSPKAGVSVAIDEPLTNHGMAPGYSPHASAAISPPPLPGMTHVARNRHMSIARRLGGCAITVLVLGTLLTVASLGFLGFLWFSNHQNSVWRYIIVNDYLVTVVTGFGKILETSLTFQVGIACSMIAALSLEGFHVLLPDAASMSKTRTEGGGMALLKMLWQQVHGGGPPGTRNWALLLLAMATGLMLLFTQVVTVVLNADIGLASLEGFRKAETLPMGFMYNHSDRTDSPVDNVLDHGTFWSKRPYIIPSFAEYSEPPVQQQGVSDTGLTLRAFLPYSSQQVRQNLQGFSGRTTVVDTRVTCQVPSIRDITIQLPNSKDALVIGGQISATHKTPRLNNNTFQWPYGIAPTETNPIIGAPVPINCLVPLDVGGYDIASNKTRSGWRTSLCQLTEGGHNRTMFNGGLVSEFQSLSPMNTSDIYASQASYNWGVGYVFLNVTKGGPNEWLSILGGSNAGTVPSSFQDRGEWRDYFYSNGDVILSATVCYASFMTADIPVEISSPTNRSEPTPSFNFDTKAYIFPNIRNQMGQNSSISLADRGIMSLKSQRSTWLANSTQELPLIEPYIRAFSNMADKYNTLGPDGNDGNISALLTYYQELDPDTGSYFNPDPFFPYLFQDIVRYGGSVAFALQTMYTMLASMTYYDQFPQFDQTAVVQRTNFVTVNMATSWSGFASVTAIFVVHLVILMLIVLMFLARTRFTMLSNDWAMISQTVSPTTADMVAMAGDTTDKEIKRWLRNRSRSNVRVGVDIVEGSSQPGIVEFGKQERSGPEKSLLRRKFTFSA